MKILQLGKFYPVRGGVEKVMYDLTESLPAYGIECDMLCAGISGKGHIVKLGPKARVICCHTWIKLAGTMISPELIFKTRKLCSGYDIVHVHHPDPTACLALFLSGYKGRVILHWHSDIIKQKTLLKFYRPLQNWLIRRADLILGTTPVYTDKSPWLRKVKDKIACLPIGVTPVNPPLGEVEKIREEYKGRKIIFSLGRMVTYKGFEYLIKAAGWLSDDYVILIGGEGPLAESLNKEIDELGVGEKVRLIGRIPDEQLPAYYGACTLFCLPSVMKTEAFGIVQIEAMSCGKPVVATTIPGSGTAWVNAHGDSGLNVPPKNPEALAQAIMEITRDESTYSNYSHNAYNRYCNVFTKAKMIDKCVEYYGYGKN